MTQLTHGSVRPWLVAACVLAVLSSSTCRSGPKRLALVDLSCRWTQEGGLLTVSGAVANESKRVFTHGELAHVKPVVRLYNADNKNVAHVESAELRFVARITGGTTVRFDSRGQAIADRFSALEPGDSARFLTVLSVRPSDTAGISKCIFVLTMRDEKGRSRILVDSVGRELGELLNR